MNTRFVSRFFVLMLVGCVFFVAASAQAARMSQLEIAKYFDAAKSRRDIEVMRVKGKDGRFTSVNIPPYMREQLIKTSPAELRKEAAHMRLQIESQCNARRNPIVQFGRDFAPESLKFYTAIGLSSGEQMKEDPAFARHFVENSFLDPFGYASFAGFMIGARGAGSLMAMAEKTYDPCVLVKRYAGPAPLLKPTRMQRLFSPLAGQLTMVAGMTVSTMIDALRDPNIQKCAALAIGKVDHKAGDAACDQAYEDWVMNGGKLRDMAPDILSMTTVGLSLASPQIAALAAKEGYEFLGRGTQKKMIGMAGGLTLRFAIQQSENTILYRGATLVMGVGRMVQWPVVRIAFEVGSMWAFFHFNDKLKPIINTPWQTVWQNWDIEKTRTQIKGQLARSREIGWNQSAAPGTRRCYADWKASTGSSAPVHCTDEVDKPAQAIALMGRQEKKWRDFLVTDTMTALSNWQNYVLQFSNMYTSSNKIYEDLLKRIDTHRKDPTYVDPFYSRDPMYGAGLDVLSVGLEICKISDKDKKSINDSIVLLEDAIKQEGRPSIVLPKFAVSVGLKTIQTQTRNGGKGSASIPTVSAKLTNDPRFSIGADHYNVSTLKSILEGLYAMDCTRTPRLDDFTRIQKFEKSSEILFWNLSFGGHSSWGMTLENPDYLKIAGDNVFMKVYYNLGGPEPHWEGGNYVRALNKNSDYINQDYKDMKPDHLQEAKTLQMSDYILASMLCGPEAAPSAAQKLAAANQDRLGWWERTKSILHGNFQGPNPYTEKDMVAVEKYYEKNVTQEPSWANLGGILKSDMAVFNNVEMWKAEFRPPRIIKDIGFNPCGDDRRFISKYVAKFDGSRSPFTMDPYFTEWTINKKTYRGMQALIQEFARPELTNTSGFTNWWTANVESHVQKVVNIYRSEFVDLMNKKYAPVMTNPVRSKINNRPFGLTNALIDSANEYLDMLVPLVNVGPNGAKAEDEMKKLRAQFMMRFRVQLMLVGPTATIREGLQSILDGRMPETRRGPAPAVPYLSGRGFADNQIPSYIGNPKAYESVYAAYQFNGNQLSGVMNSMLQLSSAQSKTLPAAAQQNLQSVMRALFENITGLVTEIDSYHGVTVAIRSPMIDTSAQK